MFVRSYINLSPALSPGTCVACTPDLKSHKSLLLSQLAQCTLTLEWHFFSLKLNFFAFYEKGALIWYWATREAFWSGEFHTVDL